MWPPEHSLITGASSGIGRAMAEALAAKGATRLTLLGRDETRLAGVAEACRDRGAEVFTASLDVRDRSAMAAVVRAAFDRAPIDLLVANAGISGLGSEDPRAVITTNIDGVLNSVEPVVPLMEQRRKGQIAIMSSLAGFRSLPNAPLYCASKSAVRSFGEGLGVRLAPQGVSVSVLCPGFIETPLTEANPFPMPLIMSAEEAAERLLDGIRRKKPRVAFPRRLYAVTRFLEVMPTSIANRLLAATAGRAGSKE